MSSLNLKKNINRVIRFNNRYFKKINRKNDKIILCEFTNNCSTQISFSLLIDSLKKEYNCKCIAYFNPFNFNFFQRIKLIIQKSLNFGIFSIYRSFQTDDFLIPVYLNKSNRYSQKTIKDILSKLKKKEDLLNLKIEGVLVGDYIYDSYLKKYEVPTIDNFYDKYFIRYFTVQVQNFYYWWDYFKRNKILTVIVSHTVYTDAMIIRIASKLNLISFQCNFHNVHKISKKRLNAYTEFQTFKKDFKKFKLIDRKKAIRYANKEMNNRLNAGYGFETLHLKKSPFHKDFSSKRILDNNNKKKILIASHCFLDAPHAHGIEGDLFNDFYEWLVFLGKISKKTDYIWYIKSHPSQLNGSIKILENFLLENKHFKFLNPSVSNFQLIKEGIDCVLTVNGSVGWEFAFFKIPVIYASTNNPTINYDFNLHPKNLNQFEKMILNFDKFKINFEKSKIKEFYFMRNIFTNSDWMIEDIPKVMKSIGGYPNLANYEFYEYWMKNFNDKKFKKISSILKNHLRSKNNYIGNYSFIRKDKKNN